MKKRIFATLFAICMTLVSFSNTVSAYAGEDEWAMMDRILYHSGSWFIAGKGVMPQAKMRQLIQVVEIYSSSPESEYAEGYCILCPGLEGETPADFIMMRGQLISFQDPGTNKAFLQMKRL